MPLTNKEKQLQLLDQILERALEEDERFKREAILRNRASKTVGEGWMVHHLKALKELMFKY